MQILIQQVYGAAWDDAFPTSGQETPMMLINGPHFEYKSLVTEYLLFPKDGYIYVCTHTHTHTYIYINVKLTDEQMYLF